MTVKMNWEANKRRQRTSVAAKRVPPLPKDLDRTVAQLYQHNRKGGERGYSTRGAQGHDSYARRNYAGKITLPRLKFLEGGE